MKTEKIKEIEVPSLAVKLFKLALGMGLMGVGIFCFIAMGLLALVFVSVLIWKSLKLRQKTIN